MDPITASLLREAGSVPVNAPPGGWKIPPAVQAQRDADSARIVAREAVGGGIPTATVVQGSAAPEAPKLDPITASLLAEANATPVHGGSVIDRSIIDQIPDQSHIRPTMAHMVPGDVAKPKPEQPQTAFDKYVMEPLKGLRGAGEAALSMGTGIIGAPVAQVAGVAKGVSQIGTPEGARAGQERVKEILDSITYRPRTPEGKEALEGVSKVIGESKIAGLGPTEAITVGAFLAQPNALKWIGKDKTPAVTSGSEGAAAAGTANQARALAAKGSPELQVAVNDALKKGGQVNIKALGRQVEAESLPVPIQLTKGQATGDVAVLSTEQNLRGKVDVFAKRFNDQNNRLIENTNLIREKAAPDVYATTKPEIGNLVIDAYTSKLSKIDADISAKYLALKNANGGQFPLDVQSLMTGINEGLKKELKTRFVPRELRSTLFDISKQGSMSFEDFEALRTITANIQRSSADGNARAAAGIIRNQLEAMPMPKGAEHLKPLADAARQAARSKFELMKKDPAMKAVSMGKASADDFIDKFIVKKDLKTVETIKANLADDAVAQQAIAAGIIDQLKRSAGIIDNTGNFTQAGYNKALDAIRPKLGAIFNPEERLQLETLGNVARYTQQQPRGSFVNNSNTATALIAEGAKSALEGGVNVAAKGLPIGTLGRKILTNRAQAKLLRESTQVGAGIRLENVK